MNSSDNQATPASDDAFALGPYTPTVFDHRDTKINQANEALFSALGKGCGASPLVVLPDDFTRHDIESYLPQRIRARGNFETPYINDFVAYAGTHKEAGAGIFVDAENMRAVAVLNLGTPEAPGHADQKTSLQPKRTAPYDALRTLVRSSQSQREMAEWLEDWMGTWKAFDGATEILPPTALQAVRNLTIEAASRSEHKEESLSAARSTFENVTAHSAHTLPSRIEFSCSCWPMTASAPTKPSPGALSGAAWLPSAFGSSTGPT